MMIRGYWEILVVDDDPDVLAVTRLALKQVRVHGIPLRIHECTSGASAIEFLNRTAQLSDLALAIVDVVMETDHAGLDVCKVIRDDLQNRITPIVVRTGQAGKAPEREVIERYDISTYLTKVEATNDKLYATVVNAVRNYNHAFAHEGMLEHLGFLITQTREGIAHELSGMNRILTRRDGTAPDDLQFHFCIFTDRESITAGSFAGREVEARRLRDRLADEPPKVLLGNGDQFIQSGEHVLLSLSRSDGAPAFDLVGETDYRPMPDYIVSLSFLYARCIRSQMVCADARP